MVSFLQDKMNDEESDDEEKARLAASMAPLSKYICWLIFLINCGRRSSEVNRGHYIFLSLRNSKEMSNMFSAFVLCRFLPFFLGPKLPFYALFIRSLFDFTSTPAYDTKIVGEVPIVIQL